MPHAGGQGFTLQLGMVRPLKSLQQGFHKAQVHFEVLMGYHFTSSLPLHLHGTTNILAAAPYSSVRLMTAVGEIPEPFGVVWNSFTSALLSPASRPSHWVAAGIRMMDPPAMNDPPVHDRTSSNACKGAEPDLLLIRACANLECLSDLHFPSGL